MIHKPLWIFKPSIFFFLITYLFLYFRGFGWDGDTLISGTQFIKLLNPALRGLQDGGTQPKILMMVLVGILSQVDHNFILLTFLCIILNSVMVGVLCNWTKKEGGNWWIVLLAICLNLNYLLLIINCDNPAFSIPFIFFGLYFYFNLKEKLKGILFLVISSFFRPGAELIIIILFLKELYYKNNKYIIQNLLAISVCFIHSYYGWFLSYPNKEVYLMTTYRNPHGKMLAVPLYLKTLYKQLQYPNISLFFGLALFGINNLLKSKRQIVNIILGVVPTIILPIATFIYGVTNHIGVEKNNGI